MENEFLTLSYANTIATIGLNRPDKRNALHGPFVVALLQALNQIAANQSIKVVILHGHGKHFCAGGDIAWMQQMAASTKEANEEDAEHLADLLYQLYSFPKPTIVLAHGATLGGGLGLLTAADIALAAKNASFGLPEVRIGIAPSVISPYVLAALGERASHYYFLTGETFDADTAYRLGLVHEIIEEDGLMARGVALAQSLSESSAHALCEVKKLIHHVGHESITSKLAEETAAHLARLRTTSQAREGLQAFLAKRKPVWNK